MFIKADDKNFSYMGRIDWLNDNTPRFYFAGTMAIIKVSGTKFAVRVRNFHQHSLNQIGYVIDGIVKKADLPYDNDIHDIELCSDLEDTEHEIIIYKTHGAHNYFELFGLICDDNAKISKAILPERKIECYGDSVSAGEVCEAVGFEAVHDPDGHNAKYDNAWYSFTMQTARLLNAQIHNIAQGGIALRDNTGYYDNGKVGLETVYNKVCYLPHTQSGYTQWDFSKYIPDVVVIAIGQNDPHHEGFDDYDIADADYRRIWKDSYLELLKNLRMHYPNACFVLCTTVLMHSDEWDKAIEEVREEANDSKIFKFNFSRNGKATPGHPRISEQTEMATELSQFINSLGTIAFEK